MVHLDYQTVNMKQETAQGIVEEWQESVYGSVLAVWPQSWRAPSMLGQLDMGNRRNVIIQG